MPTLKTALVGICLGLLTSTLGCPSSTTTAPNLPPPVVLDDPDDVDTSANARVLWKRHIALASDLSTALALPRGQLCQEFVDYDCVDEVFLSSLGGNDPYYSARYDREPRPTVVTPMALERVAWSACLTKIDQERAREGDAVFGPFALDDVVLDDDDVAALQDLLRRLTRRFFARDALPSEVRIVADLVDGETTDAEAAASVCFALATSAEFLFY